MVAVANCRPEPTVAGHLAPSIQHTIVPMTTDDEKAIRVWLVRKMQ